MLQIDVPVCRLGQYLCCTVTSSVWAAYGSVDFTDQTPWGTFKQYVMDLYLEGVLYVQLNLIITQGILSPLILRRPEVTLCTMEPDFILDTSMLCLLGYSASFVSVRIPSDFTKEFHYCALASFPSHTWDVIPKSFDMSRWIGGLLRGGCNLHKAPCPSTHLIVFLHSQSYLQVQDGFKAIWLHLNKTGKQLSDAVGGLIQSEEFLSDIDQTLLIFSDISLLLTLRWASFERFSFVLTSSVFHTPLSSALHQLTAE